MFLRLIPISVFFVLFCLASNAADSSGWAGQYADKKFLGGRAVFQLTIEQSGNAMQVSFDAAWVDGHGAAPEAEGPATVSGSTLTFKFTDTFENSGTGTITRTGLAGKGWDQATPAAQTIQAKHLDRQVQNAHRIAHIQHI